MVATKPLIVGRRKCNAQGSSKQVSITSNTVTVRVVYFLQLETVFSMKT